MPFDDLTKFLQAASDAGELERIPFSIKPDQEIAALTHQICHEFQAQSPVILFERPAGHAMPVVTNLLGSRTRFLAALGVQNLSEVIDRIRSVLAPLPAGREWKLGFGSSNTADRSRFVPRTIRRGPVQQVVKLSHELDLHKLPAIRSWQGESGPMITSGLVISEAADSRSSIEFMPVEILGPQTVQLHWNADGSTFRNWQERRQDQRSLPVAIALGGDPLLTYVASLPLPTWLDPWFFSGVLRNESINLIRARSVELHVPADAELVLEGDLDPEAPIGKGTAADATGMLQTRSELPSLHINTVTHRANPLWPSRIQSFNIGEDLVCSELTERLLTGILQLTDSDIIDLHLPACGGHRDTVYFSTSATRSDRVEQQLHAVCALPFLKNVQIVIAVGPQVNLRSTDAVLREVNVSRRLPGTSSGRLLIDATAALHESSPQHRCLPTSDVLSALARQFENSRWDSTEPAVH